MEKMLLAMTTITESETKYLNVFNSKSMELSGSVNFSTNTGSFFVIVESWKGSAVSGRYKSYEYKSSDADSNHVLSFCEMLDVEAMPAAKIIFLNNADGNVTVTAFATTKEAIL